MYFSENNINKIFQNGYLLYQGYVDDPRNTDNSWMETQGKFSSFGTSGSVKFMNSSKSMISINEIITSYRLNVTFM